MDLRNFGLSDDELRQLGYDVKRRGSPSARQGSPTPRTGLPTRPVLPPLRPLRPAEPIPSPPSRPAARGWLITLAVLVATGWGASSARRLPSPVPASSPDAEFSSGRAMAQLADVAQQARPTGSPENERVRSQLQGKLRSLGLEPELQTTTWFERESGFVRAATLRNVVARVPGAGSTGALLLTAHYDGAPLSPAAGDDGIGVATVLEAVRALLSGAPLRNDVIVLFTDGDELGQLGSRAFSEHHPWMADVSVVLSVDARGTSGPAVAFVAGSDDGRIVDLLAAAEPRPVASSAGRSVRAHALESGSRDPLLREGVRAVRLAVLGDAAWQHQPGDRRERVSERTVQHAGRQLLAMTRALGSVDLRSELSAPDQVYVSLPVIGLVHYPRGWVLVTTLFLVAFWALVGFVVRRRKATRRGMSVSVFAGLGTVAGTAAAARALLRLASGAHPEFGYLTTAFFEDATYTLAVLALALACGSSIYAVARRWASPDELVLGGLLVPLLVCVWLTPTAPFAAPALQLPLAASLVGAALVVALRPRRAPDPSTPIRVALTLVALLTLVLTVPTVELLASAWTFRAATAIGSVMGLAVLLLWPLMDSLLVPRAWWTPVTALSAAGAMIAFATPSLHSGNGHPLPTTLLYLADKPLLDAPLATLSGRAPEHASGLRSMSGRWLTVAGPGEEWARSWAGDPASGPSKPGELLLGADSLYRVAGTAPVSELAPPRGTVVHSTVHDGRREVEVTLESGLSGEMTGIVVPDGVSGVVVGVGDAHWAPGEPTVRRAVHWGVPATPGLLVRLELPEKEREIQLVIVEHHLRPREILGTYFFQRPDSLMANVAMGSDRAIQRTRLSIPLPDLAIGQ